MSVCLFVYIYTTDPTFGECWPQRPRIFIIQGWMETKVGMKGFSLQSFWISCKKHCLVGDGRQDTIDSRDILSAKIFLSSYVPCDDPEGKQILADFCVYMSYEGIWHFVFIYILSHIKCCSSLYWFVFEIWCPIFVLPLKKLWKLILRSVITCNLWRPTSVIISLRMNIASKCSSVSMNTENTAIFYHWRCYDPHTCSAIHTSP